MEKSDNSIAIQELVDTIKKQSPYYIRCKERFETILLTGGKQHPNYNKSKKLLQSITCKHHSILARLRRIDPTNKLVKELPVKKQKEDHKHVADKIVLGLDTVSGMMYNDEDTPEHEREKVVVLARSRRRVMVSVIASGLFSYLSLLSNTDDNFVFIHDENNHKRNITPKVRRFITNGEDLIGTGLREGTIFYNELGKLHVLCISRDEKIPVYCNHQSIYETLSPTEYQRWKTICRNIVMRKKLSIMDEHAKIFYCNDKKCIMSSNGFIAVDNVKPINAGNRIIQWRDIAIECPICNKSVISENELDKRTEELLKGSSRNCPSCETPSMRESGCYHMKCPCCNADWCWNCGKLRNSEDPYHHSCPSELLDEITERYDRPEEVWIEGIPQLNEEEMLLNGLIQNDQAGHAEPVEHETDNESDQDD